MIPALSDEDVLCVYLLTGAFSGTDQTEFAGWDW